MKQVLCLLIVLAFATVASAQYGMGGYYGGYATTHMGGMGGMMQQQLAQQQYQMQWAYQNNPYFRAQWNHQEALVAYDRANTVTGSIRYGAAGNNIYRYERGAFGGTRIYGIGGREVMSFEPDSSPLPRRW